MQHAIIPYHTDENGHPVVELSYFTPEHDTIRQAWDILSMVKVDNTNLQSVKTASNSIQEEAELPAVVALQQQTQEQSQSINNIEADNLQSISEESPIEQFAYDEVIDGSNPNDKNL